MALRTRQSMVNFPHPFQVEALGETLPAGTYEIETVEELVEGVSFPAYRHVSSVILVPGRHGSAHQLQVVPIKRAEFQAALLDDTDPL